MAPAWVFFIPLSMFYMCEAKSVASVQEEATTTECEGDNCDEMASMKVSMLQRRSINEHTHGQETVAALEARRAEILTELDSVTAQIDAINTGIEPVEESPIVVNVVNNAMETVWLAVSCNKPSYSVRVGESKQFQIAEPETLWIFPAGSAPDCNSHAQTRCDHCFYLKSTYDSNHTLTANLGLGALDAALDIDQEEPNEEPDDDEDDAEDGTLDKNDKEATFSVFATGKRCNADFGDGWLGSKKTAAECYAAILSNSSCSHLLFHYADATQSEDKNCGCVRPSDEAACAAGTTYQHDAVRTYMSQETQLYAGSLSKLSGFASNEYDGFTGYASVSVTATGMFSQVSIKGTKAFAGKVFYAHLHAEPCASGGGGHYKNPNGDGSANAMNENWPTTTCDEASLGPAICAGAAVNTWTPAAADLAKGLSIVVHDTPHNNSKAFCADLKHCGIAGDVQACLSPKAHFPWSEDEEEATGDGKEAKKTKNALAEDDTDDIVAVKLLSSARKEKDLERSSIAMCTRRQCDLRRFLSLDGNLTLFVLGPPDSNETVPPPEGDSAHVLPSPEDMNSNETVPPPGMDNWWDVHHHHHYHYDSRRRYHHHYYPRRRYGGYGGHHHCDHWHHWTCTGGPYHRHCWCH